MLCSTWAAELAFYGHYSATPQLCDPRNKEVVVVMVVVVVSTFFTDGGIARVVGVERWRQLLELVLLLLQRRLHIVEAGLPVDGDRGSRAAGHVVVRRRGVVVARIRVARGRGRG